MTLSETIPLTIDDDACRRFQQAAELAGKKWTASILLAAYRGAERFSEYRHLVTGVSDRMLSVRLRELENDDLIARTVIPTTPVQIRYSLTPRGRELIQGLQPLVDWSTRWDGVPAEHRPASSL
ncbi:winged helix-turn-helix transcriptional regulator [Leifsonia sp. NPDC058230]|uniref:winged helix-turn-helix transcriptional regulator n=1 Tax=Leifsonia sp. NPDC058230 TaxID=3346391 RepID=UPI0036D7E942